MSLALMNSAERGEYADWLDRFFGNRRGRIAQHFRAIAHAIKSEWEMT